MTDYRTRELERKWNAGHTDVGIEYRARLEGRILAGDRDALAAHNRAGFFWVEPTDGGPILGPSWAAYNLPVNERFVNVVMGRGYINNREWRTVDDWLEFSVDPSHDVAMASPLLDFSFKRAMYLHREHPALLERVKEYGQDELNLERKYLGPRKIAAKLTYREEGEQLTLEYVALDRTRIARQVAIPSSNQNVLALAVAQPESKLGKTSLISRHLSPLLTEIMGKRYKDAIAATQYFASRHNGKLKWVDLQIPKQGWWRSPDFRYALALKAGCFGSPFTIECNYIGSGFDGDIGDREASGWRPLHLNPQ